MMLRAGLLLLYVSEIVAFAPSLERTGGIINQPSCKSSTTSATRRFSSVSATLPEGLVKTVSKQGNGDFLRLGDVATVKYRCYLPEDSNEAPFAKSSRQKVMVGDGGMIEGWEKGIQTMRVGERSLFRINDSNLGYGAAGVPPLIPANAVIEVDIEVLGAQAAATNIDFDSLATADSTPRTAADIAAAFEERQAARALEPEKEGLEAWIEKAKNFYFFGLFEGETGEAAPWFLRPSITFPIAFLIVGAAFYVTYISGAITEKGTQSTDELDEIILSSILTDPGSLVLASMAPFLDNPL